MPTCHDLPSLLQRGDTSRPAVTCYDRTGGNTHGERIELSRRVLMTWASKAAGVLQDELDVGPGSTVGVALPPHWRAGYWAVATWWVGATLVTGADADEADVLVTDDPGRAEAHDGDTVLVALAALARAFPGEVPSGCLDEARELPTFPDRFAPAARPAPDDLAWTGGRALTYADPLTASDTRLLAALRDDELDACIGQLAGAWSGRGSLVVVRGTVPEVELERLAAVEHATRALR